MSTFISTGTTAMFSLTSNDFKFSLGLQQIFDLFGDLLRFWYSDSKNQYLVFV